MWRLELPRSTSTSREWRRARRRSPQAHPDTRPERPASAFSASAVTCGKGLNTYTQPGNNGYYSEVSVQLRTGGNVYYAPTAVTVTLTSSDPTRATVPISVTIPAGQYGVDVQVTGVDL